MPRNPRILAAAYDRSRILFSGTGPRSFTRTRTDRWLRKFVTRTVAPSGRLRWAHVMEVMLKGSPLAVGCHWNSRPYQEARPNWRQWCFCWIAVAVCGASAIGESGWANVEPGLM